MKHSRLIALPLALAALALSALSAAVLAENVDPGNDNSQFAWSENTGWINAEPANCSGCGAQVNASDLTGWMWGENIGWVNLSCQNTYGFFCTGSPGGKWGVKRSYTGDLSGYAWSENAGWINMSCTNTYGPSCTGSPGGTWGVSINPATGVFSGYAWGENIGWISFSDSSPVVYQVQTSSDFDGDGVINNVDNCPFWPNASQATPTWSIPANDSDCDGFPDSVATGLPLGRADEGFMSTVASTQCAPTPGTNNDPLPDQWPVDLNDSRQVTGPDLLAFGPVFGSFAPGPPYSVRFDLNGSGGITGPDLLKFGPFFGLTCS
jgi:hypothetical protein